MLLLSCSSKLRLLEGTLLRSLPETLLVASDDSDFYANTYAVHYRDLGACRALLGSAINWDQAFRIYGLRDGLYEASRDIAQTKGAKLDVLRFFTYFHPDPSSLPEIQLDPAVRLSSLDVSHVDLLNETWVSGGNKRSRKYLAHLTRHFPSACLLDATGHPVSWVTSDVFGALRHAYTLPQHRGRGYNTVLTNVMAKRLHSLGYPIYSNVAVDNFHTQRLKERWGFQRLPSLCYLIQCNAAVDRAPMQTPRAEGESPA
ncbi:glycine N-acyltransferase-like protein 3 [Pelodiscus sinensis]|uniref:glycine N-acyltransferase-like protein 3 n=1 Tax=Pelodiscus sinensis TaxID=13735 RepID=UPI003F6BA2B3